MNPEQQVLVVVPSYEGTTYPGSFTFRTCMNHCGFGPSDYIVLAYDAPDFDHVLADFQGTVAITLGPDAHYRLTGRNVSEDKERGYVYTPEDFVSRVIKVTEQIGTYKTSNKKTGRKVGDPKFGAVARTVSPYVPKNLKYVINTITPRKVEESGKKLYPALRADLARARSFSLGEERILEPTAFGSFPAPGKLLTLDIETEGWTGAVTYIGMTTSGAPEVMCSSRWTAEAKLILQDRINACECVQGHNLAFDIPRLEREGISFAGKERFDTMLANILLFPDLLKGLERVATLYLSLRQWKYKSGYDMAEYNALDAFITHHVAAAQRTALHQYGMFDLFTKNIMPASVVLQDMALQGIKVDQIALHSWAISLTDKLKEAIYQWHSFTTVDPASPKQLMKYFYEDLGMKRKYAPRKKKTETLSVDEDAINRLISENPQHEQMLRALLNVRKWEKQLKTYARITVSHDGRVHPSYLPSQRFTGMEDEDAHKGYASTGRPTSRNPNIQNQTPESKAIFIPSTDRHCFAEFDFSQIELRIAAALSGDRALQEALKGDVHARTMDLLGCERVYAKAVTFGTMYGAGPSKLVRTLRENGVKSTVDACTALQQAFAGAYPDLWAWRSSVSITGLSQHYLTNPFGRRRYFYGGTRQTTEMFNYFPQSTVADILIASLPTLSDFAKYYGGRIVATVHDSVLFEFPVTSLSVPLFDALKSVAEREWPNIAPGFRVPVSLKLGKPGGSWATVNRENFESFIADPHLILEGGEK